MIDSPLVSVIIPVYNSERYILETLRGILSQDYPAMEVIVVNDGSTDGSEALLTAMAASDARMKVISTPNQGPSLARMTGVRQAQGKYVQFFDSDDLMLPGAIARSVARAEETGADVVVSRFITRFLSGKEVLSQPLTRPVMTGRDYLCDVLSGKGYWSLWSMLVKRELLSAVTDLGCDLLMGEDSIWKTQILLHAAKVCGVDSPAMIYVERDDSLTHFVLLPDKKFIDLLVSEDWLWNYVGRNADGAEFDVPLAIWRKNVIFQHIHYQRLDEIEAEMRELWHNIERYPEVAASMNRHERKVAGYFRRSMRMGVLRLKFKFFRKRLKSRLRRHR